MKRTRAELLRMLVRCRPFVYRAMWPSKVPHDQDKKDAEDFWPEIDAATKGVEVSK